METREFRRGIGRLLAGLREARRHVHARAAGEVLAGARERASVGRRDLRASGRAGADERQAIARFTAGHAARAHEDLDAIHAVGEAKFLGRALHERGGEALLQAAAEELRRLGRV